MKSQTFFNVILKTKKLIFLWKDKNFIFRREDPKKLNKSTLGITAQLILEALI